MRCEQCSSTNINGVNCHETGCPNSHIDLSTGKPHKVKCLECGCDFQPIDKESFCDHTCMGSYLGE